MSRASFVVLIMIGLFCSTTIAQRCPPNQEFTTCGSACPPSCDRPFNQACTLQCIVGCQCRQGYLLHSSGNKSSVFYCKRYYVNILQASANNK